MDDRRRGLKLIELMVIIGIIGITLGILVPMMRSGHNHGRRAQCQNNL